MRSIWSGAISFGLVNIPIKLYSAVESKSLKFNMLSKKDLSPVKYKRVAESDGEELSAGDMVKGFQYDKDQYVVVEDADFEKVSPQKTKAIEILNFIYEDEIDPLYFDKPYYLEPDKNSAKPYTLLREALKESKKVGIASFVLRNKEHLAMVKPFDNVIILNILRFASDIRGPQELTLPSKENISNKELDMAKTLIEQLTEPFDPEKYTDTYTEDLKGIIESKAKGKSLEIPKEPKVVHKTDNLLDMLKASLEAGKGKPVDRPPKKKIASDKKAKSKKENNEFEGL
jgi:DNA end-binding protein Ku